jgi:hypothetical protein
VWLVLATACGGSLAGGPEVDDAGDATTTDARDDGGVSDGGVGDAPGPRPDAAGADAGAPLDGGGALTCGASTCSPPAEVCCPGIDGGSCAPIGDGAAPCGPPHDFVIACERSSDCPTGQVCCFEFHHGCDFNAFCFASCDQSAAFGRQSFASCETSSDCADSGPCAAHVCQNGSAGIPVHTCSPPPSFCCP